MTVCQWFSLKTTGVVFSGLTSKPVVMIFSDLTSKSAMAVSPNLVSKLVASDFSVWASKPTVPVW
jgi:hypothetical protein